MNINLKQAVRRLQGGYLDGTLSGAEILYSAFSFVEMYHFTFMEKLATLGVTSDDDLESLLAVAINIRYVGDVTGFDSPDMVMTCMMGLVLLDRMAQTGWGKLDNERCFELHEQMFECFELVINSEMAQKRARKAAMQRAINTNKAKTWVRSEWEQKNADYKNNKSDFARTYVALVKAKFLDNKGDPLSVTEKTIREAWLSTIPRLLADRPGSLQPGDDFLEH